MPLIRKYVERVRAGAIQTDHAYQRPLTEPMVRKLVKSFNQTALGVLHVSLRADGTLWIIDGQHRLAAVLRMDGSDWVLDVMIYEGLTQAEEAALFLALNDDKQVKPEDKFRAKVTSGDPDALAIVGVADALKLKIDPRNSAAVRAVRSVEYLYANLGGEGLGLTLSAAATAWRSEDPDRFKGDLLLGIGMFLGAHGLSVIDHARLTRVLAKTTPARILLHAREQRMIRGRSVGANVASHLVAIYNKGLTHRLPELSVNDYGRTWVGEKPRPSRDAILRAV